MSVLTRIWGLGRVIIATAKATTGGSTGAGRGLCLPTAGPKSAKTIEEGHMGADIGGLVDADRGLISRPIFIEQGVYEEEQERIFARCRLFLCPHNPNPQP